MTQPAPPAYPTPPVVVATRSGVGPLRHLASLVLTLVLTPIGMLLVDLGHTRGLLALQQGRTNGPGVLGFVLLGVGGLLLLVAAACGRLSGVGPMVAGLVWGAAPLLWLLAAPTSFVRAMFHAPRLPQDVVPFTGYFTTEGYAVFTVVAALMIGCAVSGRWR